MKFLCLFKHDWECLDKPDTTHSNPNAVIGSYIIHLFAALAMLPRRWKCRRCGKEKVR